MSESLSAKFPRPAKTVKARWAPIFLSPVLGSPERLVVAVAAVSEEGFHVETANALKRLECLYGRAAETALFATEVALEELRTGLASRGPAALTEGALVFSGVTIGEVTDGEARTVEDLARAWMKALSSLYRFDQPDAHGEAVVNLEQAVADMPDRLPVLVLDHVKMFAPPLTHFFSEEIRLHRRRRTRSRIAGISIDYAGSQFVANFATLQASARAHSVDRIKRKMFDLKVKRDEDHSLFGQRAHEMIIFTPSFDSPLINERQVDRLDEALEELTDQSTREGFALSAMHGVAEIGKRLLEAEAPV